MAKLKPLDENALNEVSGGIYYPDENFVCACTITSDGSSANIGKLKLDLQGKVVPPPEDTNKSGT